MWRALRGEIGAASRPVSAVTVVRSSSGTSPIVRCASFSLRGPTTLAYAHAMDMPIHHNTARAFTNASQMCRTCLSSYSSTSRPLHVSSTPASIQSSSYSAFRAAELQITHSHYRSFSTSSKSNKKHKSAKGLHQSSPNDSKKQPSPPPSPANSTKKSSPSSATPPSSAASKKQSNSNKGGKSNSTPPPAKQKPSSSNDSRPQSSQPAKLPLASTPVWLQQAIAQKAVEDAKRAKEGVEKKEAKRIEAEMKEQQKQSTRTKSKKHGSKNSDSSSQQQQQQQEQQNSRGMTREGRTKQAEMNKHLRADPYTSASMFSMFLETPSQADTSFYEDRLLPALKMQPWAVVSLETERKKLAKAVFEWNKKQVNILAAEEQKALARSAALAAMSPSERALVEAAELELATKKAEEKLSLDKWKAEKEAQRIAAGLPPLSKKELFPPTITYTNPLSPFCGKTLPFPQAILSGAIFKQIKPIFSEANTINKGYNAAQEMQTAATGIVVPTLTDAQLQELYEEYKTRLFHLLGYTGTILPPYPQHLFRHLLEPVNTKLLTASSSSAEGANGKSKPMKKLEKLESSSTTPLFHLPTSFFSAFDIELLHQLYVLLPTAAFRVFIRLLHHAPLPAALGQDQAEIEQYVQRMIEAEPLWLQGDLAAAGTNVEEASLKSKSTRETSPLPALLPWAPFNEPFPVVANVEANRPQADGSRGPLDQVEFTTVPALEQSPSSKPHEIWVEGDEARMSIAFSYLFENAIPKPVVTSAKLSSEEAAAKSDDAARVANGGAEGAFPSFDAPPATPVTPEEYLYQTRLKLLRRGLKSLMQAPNDTSRLARWLTKKLSEEHKAEIKQKTQVEASASASSGTSSSDANSALVRSNLSAELQGLTEPVDSRDDAEARHKFIHALCSTLLPSQTRALSLLLHLFKANVGSHTLFELLNSDDRPVRPSLKGPQAQQQEEKQQKRSEWNNKTTASLASIQRASLDPLSIEELKSNMLKFRDTVDEQPPVDTGATDEQEANPAVVLAEPSSSGSSSSSTMTTSSSGGGKKKLSEEELIQKRKELQSFYAQVEAIAAADVQSHWNKLQQTQDEIEKELLTGQARVSDMNAKITAAGLTAHQVVPEVDNKRNQRKELPMSRLSEAVEKLLRANQSEVYMGNPAVTPPSHAASSSKSTLLASTKIDQQLLKNRGEKMDNKLKLSKEAFDARSVDVPPTPSNPPTAAEIEVAEKIALATARKTQRNLLRKYQLFLAEMTRILGPFIQKFFIEMRKHYAFLSTEEFEAIREKYPESESQPYVAFKVHQGSRPATPIPAYGQEWHAAEYVPQPAQEKDSKAVVVPAATATAPAVSAESGATAAQLAAAAIAAGVSKNSTMVHFPVHDTPVITFPSRTVYLSRNPYISQWRTSFGVKGSFDFMTPIKFDVPSLSFSNDLHSRAVKDWFNSEMNMKETNNFEEPDAAVAAAEEPAAAEASLPSSTHKLYIRNLHPEISAAELLYAFRHLGPIVGGEIFREVLKADLSTQAMHLLDSRGKAGASIPNRDAKKKVQSDRAKSPVYAFLYFADAASVVRATSSSLKLFGLNAKGYTMYPEAAVEKRSLVLQFSQRTIHQQFHQAFPLAHASGDGPVDLTPATTTDPETAHLVKSEADISNAPTVSSFRSSVQEFTMSRIQRDVYARATASGLTDNPFRDVRLSSKMSLYNNGTVTIDCKDHEMAVKMFQLLNQHKIADQHVTLSWATSKPQKFEVALPALMPSADFSKRIQQLAQPQPAENAPLQPQTELSQAAPSTATVNEH